MLRIVNRRDLDFVMFELLKVQDLLNRPRFEAFDRDAINQILDAAQQIAEDRFQPIAALVDAEEPRFVDGKAITPPQTGEALRAFADAGFFRLSFDAEVGGMQAPWFLNTAVSGIFNCANTPVTNYAFLTVAAANLLNAFGSQELKDKFLPNMLAGQWFGTMCLSETQAGSSLADIRTKAALVGDGMYRIEGSKMWISGGEHDIADNIVHMVLAKIPGGPVGTKGISLFLVPKRRLSEDGAAGDWNHIALAGLNHKMGQRATTNCALNFSDGGDTIGYLIGEPHRGIEYMFQMMNEARIGVGHASVMAGLAGYFYSADYAAGRPQGRLASQRDPTTGQVPIIEHTDVKRMLMAQKSAVEGAQALCFYCATLIDEIATSPNEEATAAISQLLGLLTPVVKSWPSEHCLEANKWAIQILGGYGYTRDYPVERYYRDNRLNHIHEGTFGIQGLDLLGRKISGDGGAALQQFVGMMHATIAEARSIDNLHEDADGLTAAISSLIAATTSLMATKNADVRLANATLFLDAFGTIVVGWIWLRQAQVAAASLAGLDPSHFDHQFYQGKLLACRYFTRHQLPLARTRLEITAGLDTSSLDSPSAVFLC